MFDAVAISGDVDVNLDDVASQAMAAVESAVKEQTEAETVVKAMQEALEKTLKELQVGGL